MNFLAAALLGLAILAVQVLHGGLLVPAFSVPSDILLVLAAGAAVFAAMRNPAPVAPEALAAIAIFVGYLGWRAVHGADVYFGRVELGMALAGGLAFAIAHGGLTSVGSRFLFLGLVGAAAALQAVLGIAQFAFGDLTAPLGWFSNDLRAIYESRFSTRALGLFLNPNQFSWVMGWAALFSISISCWGRITVLARIVLIYLSLVFVGADVLSGSRGGVLGLLAGLVTFGAVSILAIATTLRRGRLGLSLATGGLLALAMGAGTLIYSTNWVTRGRVDAMRMIGDVRAPFFEHARRQFQVAPLLGEGPGSFLYAARLYRADAESNDALFAHDDWLQTLVDYGFVGFAIALLAIGILLGGAVRRFLAVVRRRARMDDRPQSNTAAVLLGAISSSIAFCVHSLTDFNMHLPANAFLGAATLGLLAGTGGLPASERRLPAVVLRAVSGLSIIALAVALGIFTWSHAYPDYEALRAQNSLAEGQVWPALKHADAGLAWENRHAALLAARGQALYSYESALRVDDAAIKTFPPNSSGNPSLADWTPSRRKEIYEAAADAYERALQLQPRERSYRIARAEALREVRKFDQARSQFLEAIELDPGLASPYGRYADYLHDQGQFMRALRLFDVARGLSAGEDVADRFQDLQQELTPPADEEGVAPSGAEHAP